MKRVCGACTLCCRLLPVHEGVHVDHAYKGMIAAAYKLIEQLPKFDKAGGEKCTHQCSKGCRIYERRPLACRTFECGWLRGADVRRPDHAGYVIDPVPDHVKVDERRIEVVQVWVDPARDADWMNDVRFRRFANMVADTGRAIILRYNESDGSVLLPPALSPTGAWSLTPRAPANAKQGEI
jgi:hypothetical protein